MSPDPRAEIKVLQLPWDFVAGVLRVVTLGADSGCRHHLAAARWEHGLSGFREDLDAHVAALSAHPSVCSGGHCADQPDHGGPVGEDTDVTGAPPDHLVRVQSR
jgi:hypothetical protein